MKNALLYVRVSSKEQEKEGYSLDAQEKLGYEYAAKYQMEIVKTWKVSESAWSQSKERTAFIQMIEYAKKHPEIEHIIFDITDRMTRNDFDKIKIIDLIQYHNKTIHFSRSNKVYNRNSGSDDLFVLDIEVAVAKKMSNDISRKTKMGMQEKAEQGVYPGGSPIGYRLNPETKRHEFDSNAEHIKKAFKLIASRSFSLEMTCDELYKDGLRGKRKNRFGSGALYRVLRSPFYYGAFMFKGKLYEGNHPPLISKDMFDAAHAALRSKGRPYAPVKGFAYSNLFICGDCGCKILGELKKKRYVYYHCSFSKGRHDEIGYIPEDKVAQMFEDVVRQVTVQDKVYEWLKEMIWEASQDRLLTRDKRVSELQTEINQAKERLSKLIDLKLDAAIPDDLFNMKHNELNETIAKLKWQLRQAEVFNPDFYENGLRTLELSKSLYPEYLTRDSHGRAKILRTIASNYVINDVSICPKWRKPFDLMAKGLSHSLKLRMLVAEPKVSLKEQPYHRE